MRIAVVAGSALAVTSIAAAVLLWLVDAAIDALRRATRRSSHPPGPDAIRPDQAREAAASLIALDRPRRSDLAMQFAPTVATSVEALLHGTRYFEPIFKDFLAAQDHIHILIYGYKPGVVGQKMLDVLAAKVREGVQVRVAIDSIGSEIAFGSRELFEAFRAAGIETVANHALPLNRLFPSVVGGHAGRLADLMHFDHRKMIVVDGRIAYVGGTGIEDKYADERFYDVMCRMTGPIVAQLQLVFLASWHYRGGASPRGEALDACFPPETLDVPGDAPERIPSTVLWNVPGTGHHPITDAFEQSFAVAQERIEIVNPYITNRPILDLLHAAAQRGVRLRIIVPGKPTPPFPAAAFRHHYARLIEAGVEILHHPEMAHAKVATVDDEVFVGGCNLDDLSLFRNDELDVVFHSHEMADQADDEVFAELAAMSSVAKPSTRPLDRLWHATMDRLWRLL